MIGVEALADACSRLAREGGGSVALPVSAAPLALLGAEPGLDAAYWAPPNRQPWAGLGAVSTLTLGGTQRLEDLAARAAALLPSPPRSMALDGARPLEARAFGGLSFAAESAGEEIWSGFGAGRFHLPRWLLGGEPPSLALVVAADEDPNALSALASRTLELAAALERSPRVAHPGAPARWIEREELGRSDWSAQVRAALERIEEGELEKVVLARRTRLVADRRVEPLGVLAALDRDARQATRFALRSQGAVLLGASPERLVARQGGLVLSDAIAGSSARAGDGSADDEAETRRLLDSPKERHEHALTVRGIAEVLRSFCDELEIGDVPEVLRLRHVQHLVTPIRGRLEREAHVLDLVAALHPTPAVGGCPRDEALSFIATRETTPRGWYAGPVGWFDAAGDGDFRVALRSGLLSGRTVLVHAGAGIVAGSHPDQEYDETSLKLRAMLGALEPST